MSEAILLILFAESQGRQAPFRAKSDVGCAKRRVGLGSIVYGSGIGDGNRHNHDNLPVLLAGKGGGTLRAGRHVRYPKETPLANLHLTLLSNFGLQRDRIGDSTARLTI